MTIEPHADHWDTSSYVPRRVSDRRLAALDLAGAVLVTLMALGPLSVYAVFGG